MQINEIKTENNVAMHIIHKTEKNQSSEQIQY